MKIRRSARTIIATLLLLNVFTLFTAWHNQAPGSLSSQDQQELIKELGLKNPGLLWLIKNMNYGKGSSGFYAIGTASPNAWPKRIYRASYSDPLAGLGRAIPGQELIRYRSTEDFLFILNEAEIQTPGSLDAMVFQDFRTIPEPALALSFRLVISLLLGVVGLMVVNFYNRKKLRT